MDTKWSVIIAAAGKASRLGITTSKLLYPVGDKLIIDYIVPHLDRFARSVVVLQNQQQSKALEPHLSYFTSKQCPNEIVYAYQDAPLGTADAVRIGLDAVATKYTMVLWGDQLVHPDVISEGMEMSEQDYNGYDLFCPVISRANPYVYLNVVRDRIIGVKYQREGAVVPLHGIADAGVFFFKTSLLRSLLLRAIRTNSLVGQFTGEHNFPSLLQEFCFTRLLPIAPEHSIGINVPAEAIDAASIIKSWR